ncbi:MAG: hypothetical protein OXF25_04325 [Cyanobacteria bacterium MAG CAR3_bin_5]|nr:hypothetical protein [Cyanobacteria bacterium MAG CAR3_bin_5]
MARTVFSTAAGDQGAFSRQPGGAAKRLWSREVDGLAHIRQ